MPVYEARMTAKSNLVVEADVVAISSPVELLVQLLKQASLISRPMIEGVAAPNGLSANELRIIMCLGGEGALAGHEISVTMAIPPMNVSRAIAALVGRGWVENVRDPANRRRKPVQLSAAGWERYRSLIPDVAAVASDLLAGLSASEKVALARIAAKVIAGIERWQS
jgi:DNA-binding MarR family transcriptional regulator